ncbi:MAG: hypothetical protein KDC24_04405 [Saprospiraceae bacterium]|nr:hypothetical protein [Saprospiraceae bacterium]
MKHNYDFRINPKIPGEEQIAHYKDFDALLQQFEADKQAPPPAPKRQPVLRWLAVAGTLAAGIAAFFIYVNLNTDSYEVKAEKYFAAQPYVNPPIKSLDKPLAAKKIVAEKGGVIESPSGSKYTIAPDAIVAAGGEKISGEVTIHYRELHDYVDFFLAGIPMTYDSAGTTWQFESAGMVEITAEQNGQQLAIDPEKPIEVELVSEIPLYANQEIPKYNIYQLNTTERAWNYANVDNIQVVETFGTKALNADGTVSSTFLNGQVGNAVASIDKQRNRALNQLEQAYPRPIAPVKPQRANGTDFVFNLDFNENDVHFGQGLTAAESKEIFERYKKSFWQVHPTENIAAEELKKNWDDAEITALSNVDFSLTLIKGEEKLEVKVSPVLSAEQFQVAMAEYNQLMADYDKEIEAREKLMAPEIAAVNKKFDRQIEEATANSNLASGNVGWAKVVNRFAVSEFGIWNCDRPYKHEGSNVKADFVDNEQQLFDNHTAFLAEKNRNTVMRIFATDDAKVRFNEKSDNLLWIVTENNQIALLRPEDFDKWEQNKSPESFTFVLDVLNDPVASEEKLRDILQF